MDIDTEQRSNSLKKLFNLQDEAFIQKAYQIVLGRAADDVGLAHHISFIRDGANRIAILESLRFSIEGRNVNIFFPELDTALSSYRSALRPVRGKILRKFRMARRAGLAQREINRLENRLARIGVAEEAVAGVPYHPKDIASTPSRKITGNVALPAKVWFDRPAIKRILVLKLDHFGDFFVAVRAFWMLREAWPHAHITLVCGSWNVDLAHKLGLFDQVFEIDLPLMTRQSNDHDEVDWIDRCDGIKSLPVRSYDLAIDLRHDLDTRPCLLFIDATFKAGYDDRLSCQWPDGLSPINIALPQVDLHAELICTLLAQLAITTLQPPEVHPINGLARSNGVSPPFASGTYLVVCPGAAARNRRWPAERFGVLLHLIREQVPYNVVLIGSAGDRTAIATIAASLPAGAYVDLCGAPFEDLPPIFLNAAMFIGCDSGPGHLSALLGTPTLSIYAGVSSPHVWQPLGPRVAIVHSQTPCAYCHHKECAHEFRCMDEISVDEVFSQFNILSAASSLSKIAKRDGESGVSFGS